MALAPSEWSHIPVNIPIMYMNRLVTFLISPLTIFLILTTFLTGCCKSDEHVSDALAEVANSKDEVSLGDITSYKWDTVYVIGPYQPFDHSEINGIPQKVKKRLKSQELCDTWFILLFTSNQDFVSYSDVRRGIMDGLGLKEGIYSPETIIPIPSNID